MKKNVRYCTAIPEKQTFFELYKTTGWKYIIELGEDQLFTAINNSWFMVSALIEDKLVGFGRVISDGVFQAFICDLIVDPDYQRQGIGGSILKELLKRCAVHNILSVQLCCTKGKSQFYMRFGFAERNDDAPGMWWKDRTSIT
jgi:ribosomal protein S18 acetylase RimI-like enzyme